MNIKLLMWKCSFKFNLHIIITLFNFCPKSIKEINMEVDEGEEEEEVQRYDLQLGSSYTELSNHTTG